MELIVVIGIIGILSAVLVASFSGSTESARAVKCLSNLRTLAQATLSDGSAACGEDLDISTSGGSATPIYCEVKGWISGDTQGYYTWYPDLSRYGSTTAHENIPIIGLYESDRDRARFALTNGWMYARVGGKTDVFVCPTHAKLATGQRPNWSYVMQNGNRYTDADDNPKAAERTLLFAEIPFRKEVGGKETTEVDKSADESTDGVLQYAGSPKETIGCNHKVGKNLMAHVAFVDGHVEKLNVDGLNDQALEELTTWLCDGVAVGRSGDRYEELK